MTHADFLARASPILLPCLCCKPLARTKTQDLGAFPERLWYLLSKESEDIITWMPNGTCFRVEDKERFVEESMPKYFKQ